MTDKNRILTIKAIGLIVFLAATLNALAFASVVAIPTPMADTWFFINTFVRNALEDKLTFTDFFVQRSAGDHAQPLQKLLLLADVHWADLDFRVEALWATTIGALVCAWLTWYVSRDAQEWRQIFRATLCGCVVFCVGLSLNVDTPYSWYLVGYTWILYACAFAYWVALNYKRSTAMSLVGAAAGTFLLGLALDEYAIPVYIALVIAITFRDGLRDLRPAAVTFLGGGVGMAASRMLLKAMGGAEADITGGSLQSLLDVLTRADAWRLVVGPLADSVVYRRHLIAYFPDHWLSAQLLIAAALLFAHVLFWRHAFFRHEHPREGVLVVAIALMLLFYASVAGIALSRIPQFGMEYVHQPRYVVIYKINLIALALMFLTPRRKREQGGISDESRYSYRLASIGAIALVALQIPQTKAAWDSSSYIRAYAQNSTLALVKLARNPMITPATGCPATLNICFSPPKLRQATISLLKEHKLSIFSEKFRIANGFTHLRIENGVAPAMQRWDCRVGIVAWGARKHTSPSVDRPALWFKIDSKSSDFLVELNGMPLYLERSGTDVVAPLSEASVRALTQKNHSLDVICDKRRVSNLVLTEANGLSQLQ